MSPHTKINLYSLILGLPEDVRDPDHYQVLGLPRFTDDVRAIREAAVVQNSKLLKWQNSEFFKDSLRLIAQIVEARRILENPVTRRAYDETLGRFESSNDPDDLGSVLERLKLNPADREISGLTPVPRPRDVNPVFAERRKRLRNERLAEHNRRAEEAAQRQLQFTLFAMIGCLVLVFLLGLILHHVSRPKSPASETKPPRNATATSNSNLEDGPFRFAQR